MLATEWTMQPQWPGRFKTTRPTFCRHTIDINRSQWARLCYTSPAPYCIRRQEGAWVAEL